MSIIRRGLWHFISRWMGLTGVEGGEIVLSHGNSVVTVPTNAQGKRIWVCMDEPPHSIPVCCGDVNLIGVKLTDHGFVICADIKTDVCIVEWFIEF
jgi:hypothetical protein